MPGPSKPRGWPFGLDMHEGFNEGWPELAPYQSSPDPTNLPWYCLVCDRLLYDPSECMDRNHNVQIAMNNASASRFSRSGMLTGQFEPPENDSASSNSDNVFTMGSSFESSGTHGSVVNLNHSGQTQYRKAATSQPILVQDTPSPMLLGEGEQLHVASQPPSSNRSVPDPVPALFPNNYGLSEAQETQLYSWLRRCESEHQPPTDREIELIASLQGLTLQVVRLWFQNHSQAPDSFVARAPSAQSEAPGAINLPPLEGIVSDIASYAIKRTERPCEKSRYRENATGGHLKCIFGCEYSTQDCDDWRRHLETTYPQKFWHCVVCRDTGRKPWICHRIDKFIPHVRKEHGIRDQNDCINIRDRSHVPYAADFPSLCPLYYNSIRCRHQSGSWEEFLQHCLEHFYEHVEDGPWQLRYQQRKDFDEDDGDEDRSSSNSGSRGLLSWHTNAKSSSKAHEDRKARHRETCRKGSHSNNKGHEINHDGVSILSGPDKVGSESSETTREPRSAILPTCLIDVEQLILVPSPKSVKYLALDYSWASQRLSQARKLTDNLSSLSLTAKSSCSNLPPAFQKAITLTREMGYQYLWIDMVCEDADDDSIRLPVYKKATLIIVIVGLNSSADRIWHLTCHLRNLDNVLSWAQESISALSILHVQNLGHGTFGIVDEVRLRQHSFARKMCMSRRDDEILVRSEQLREIEILQRFDHPNITRFVAAYVQKHHLNILMSPVAECNLKEYMTNPWNWMGRRKYIRRWFFSLSSALEHMHSLSCRHKDIKPTNILISGEDVLLSDFGTSKDFSATDSGSEGLGSMTPKYCAPEVAYRWRRGRSADIFSLGCVFAELITFDFCLPMSSLSEYMESQKRPGDTKMVYYRNIASLIHWLRWLKMRAVHTYQQTLIEICMRMLNPDPSQRPTASEVRNITSLASEKTSHRNAILAQNLLQNQRQCSKALRGLTILQQRAQKRSPLLHERDATVNLDHSDSRLPPFKCSARQTAQHQLHRVVQELASDRQMWACARYRRSCTGTCSSDIMSAFGIIPVYWVIKNSSSGISLEGLGIALASIELPLPKKIILKEDCLSSLQGTSACERNFSSRTASDQLNSVVVVIRVSLIVDNDQTNDRDHGFSVDSLVRILMLSLRLAGRQKKRSTTIDQSTKVQERQNDFAMPASVQCCSSKISSQRGIRYNTGNGSLLRHYNEVQSPGDLEAGMQRPTNPIGTNANMPSSAPPDCNVQSRQGDCLPIFRVRRESDMLSCYSKDAGRASLIIYALIAIMYLAFSFRLWALGLQHSVLPALPCTIADWKMRLEDTSLAPFASPTTIRLTISEACLRAAPTPAPPSHDIVDSIRTDPTQASFLQNSSLLLTIDCTDTASSKGGGDRMPSSFSVRTRPSSQPTILNRPEHSFQNLGVIDNATYFPFEHARHADQFAFGRSFLEQTFIFAGYDNRDFTLEPCNWEHGQLFVLSNATDYLGLLCYSDAK